MAPAAIQELLVPPFRHSRHPFWAFTTYFAVSNVFCRFFPKFSTAEKLLNKKLRKEQATPFPLVTAAKKGTAESLEELLKNLSILALPRVKGQYTVDTASCNSQVVCILL